MPKLPAFALPEVLLALLILTLLIPSISILAQHTDISKVRSDFDTEAEGIAYAVLDGYYLGSQPPGETNFGRENLSRCLITEVRESNEIQMKFTAPYRRRTLERNLAFHFVFPQASQP